MDVSIVDANSRNSRVSYSLTCRMFRSLRTSASASASSDSCFRIRSCPRRAGPAAGQRRGRAPGVGTAGHSAAAQRHEVWCVCGVPAACGWSPCGPEGRAARGAAARGGTQPPHSPERGSPAAAPAARRAETARQHVSAGRGDPVRRRVALLLSRGHPLILCCSPRHHRQRGGGAAGRRGGGAAGRRGAP